MENGESVLVYCREGRHRSVAMAASVLVGQGFSVDDAMQLISSRRAKADPYAWHIQRRIRKFEKIWRKSHSPR
jgi:protein-tyrosine phosphatase